MERFFEIKKEGILHQNKKQNHKCLPLISSAEIHPFVIEQSNAFNYNKKSLIFERKKMEKQNKKQKTTETAKTSLKPVKNSTTKKALLKTTGLRQQKALLKNRNQKITSKQKKEKKPQRSTPWSKVAKKLFPKLDKNKDGFISKKEANEALSNPEFVDEEAAAISTIHKFIEMLEEISNDEWFDENDGVTLKDILKYEKGFFKDPKKRKKYLKIEWNYFKGRRKIKNTKRTLFARGFPSLSALKQGAIGDCYFLAALGSYLARNPMDLVNMIEENKSGNKVVSYTVKFPGKLGTVTVSPPTDGEIARYSSSLDDGLWLVVMEKAYAKARSGKKNVNVQEEIGEGGSLAEGISAFSSASIDTDILLLTRKSTTKRKLDAAFGRGKGKDKGKKRIVTAAIASSNEYGLPKNHAYSILNWDGKLLKIRNPWGKNPKKENRKKDLRGDGINDPYKTGIFYMTLDEFDDTFSEISYEER